jgi:hypothetical protein
LRHGYGKLVDSNGTIYSGIFRNDMPDGIFKIEYANGEVVEGVDV